jgi:3-oxoacyl-[acyl-carrier protein] reductase
LTPTAPGGTGAAFSFPEGQFALITGGSRGIGRAVAIDLARVGFDIWLNYRSNHEAAREVQKTIEELGRRCKLLCFDVSDPDAVSEHLLPELSDKSPYVLVNNAGIARDALMVWMNYEEWRSVISVTLDGFFLVTKAVLHGMLSNRAGRIINISSTSGQAGRPGQANYSAAKAGLIGATKALAAEVGKRGVLVNAVAPGLIETDMLSGLPLEKVLPAIPLGRIGSVDEVAGIVTYLCSNQAAYITGQVIGINGGLYV